MNIEEYISSGILESYVLGQTSESENALITCLIKTNPSVAEEVRAIQDAFEFLALESSIQPPKDLKADIWREINSESETSIGSVSDNVNSINPQKEFASIDDKTKIITIQEITQKETKVVQLNWLKYAASFALIILSSSFALYFYFQNKDINQRFAELEKNSKTIEKSEKLKQDYLNFLAHNQTERIVLAGVPEKPNAKALVFWNKENKHVMISEVDLPETPKDMQYQLWAIVDGKPVDAGMLDLDSQGKLLEMKTIESSQAFAITLEPMGGSESPHLEDLCVIGNVK
ncbi:MAG: anti-sigma factor [Bacteroidota bacterium]